MHFAYIQIAELLYQAKPIRATLDRYATIVFETAEFMASYADPHRPWPYQQIEKPHRDELGEILLRTAAEFPDSKITNAFSFYHAADFSDDTYRVYLKMADFPTK